MQLAADSRNSTPKIKPREKSALQARSLLDSAGITRRIAEYRRSQRIYTQGDPATTVMCIQQGGVKLTVVNPVGKEAVVAVFGPGDFFGEGIMAGQSARMGTATAIIPTTILAIRKSEMVHLLHTEHEFSDCFITYMLSRTIRTEEALIDQLFNSAEKRLARALLLLAGSGIQDRHEKMFPKLSQEALAEMIGTTRSRVNFFMKKFSKMGFIGYGDGLHINPSLRNFVLHG
jgi:CRP/FNR family transcriptional regulator, cyclic AMP receptor protein